MANHYGWEVYDFYIFYSSIIVYDLGQIINPFNMT